MEYYDVVAMERDLRKVAPVKQSDFVHFAKVCKRVLGHGERGAKRDVVLFLLSLALLMIAAVVCICGVAAEGLWRIVSALVLIALILAAWVSAVRFGKNEEIRAVARDGHVARVEQGIDNFLKFFEERGWGRDEMEALRFRANAASQSWKIAVSGRVGAVLSAFIACSMCVIPLCLEVVLSDVNERLVVGLLLVATVALTAQGLYRTIEALVPEFAHSPGEEVLDLIYLCQMNGRFSFQARSVCAHVGASSPGAAEAKLPTVDGTGA